MTEFSMPLWLAVPVAALYTVFLVWGIVRTSQPPDEATEEEKSVTLL